MDEKVQENIHTNIINKSKKINRSKKKHESPRRIDPLRVKLKMNHKLKEVREVSDVASRSLVATIGRKIFNAFSKVSSEVVTIVNRKHYCTVKRDLPGDESSWCASNPLPACCDVCSEVTGVNGAVRSTPVSKIALRPSVLESGRFFVVTLSILAVFASLHGTHCGAVYVDDKVQNYLSNFGYLPESNSEAGNLRTDHQLKEAIKDLQRFGNIPVTGEIDAETKELLSRPRCGIPDSPNGGQGMRMRRFVQQGAVWNHTDLTWSLQRKPQNLDVGGVRAELSRALSVWSDNSKLTFREINSDKADIVISFAKRYHDDNYPFDGRGQILAHAFFPGGGRGGDAHFDDEEVWLLSDAKETDEGTSLFAVAAHEFGHSLGLSHSSVEGALMYPWYQGLKPNFQLPEDDRLGIQNMYGIKEGRMWGKIPPNLPTEAPRVYTTERPDIYPDRPRYPVHYPERYPDSSYPRYRPTPAPRRPTYTERPPNRRPEHPGRRPQYPDQRPQYPENPDPRPDYPEKRPIVPARRPEYTPPRNYPDRRPSYATPRPRIPARVPEENPDRRTHKYYPESKPHHPHPSARPHVPHTTSTEYPHHPSKPEIPRKPHSPKKPYFNPDKAWRPEKRPSTEVTPTGETKAPKPDSCNTNYDAVALIRGEVFIFKSQYLWRIGDMGVMEGFPTFINRMWSGLPGSLTHVDAVYERPDRKIVFFIGKEYYVFNASNLEDGYPKSLSNLGLPHTLEHLNAAMVWGHNGKTYFYNETMYWKYDEDVGKVELDYPRDMSMWKGVGNNIDSVFQWKDGKTYFFKGKGFWKFNDLHMRVENEKQILSGPFWMGCRYPGDDGYSVGNKQPYQGLPPSPTSTFDMSKGHSLTYNPCILLTITIYFILNTELT